jgi:hypothetical protein
MKTMSDQRLASTLWIVVPSLMAVLMHARGAGVQVVARGLPAAPVALATDHRPASADGFMWETRSTPTERQFRAHDGRMVRVTAQPGGMLLWCREVGSNVYSLSGQGPDRFGPPCVVDPPFVLRRQPLGGGAARVVRDNLPSSSVYVMPSGAVCYADSAGIHRISPRGGTAELLCRRADRSVTAWGAANNTLYWIEEAMPGARDPVGSCRLVAFSLHDRQPQTMAWAPDALTDLVVSGNEVTWYHPASRTLETAQPEGQVAILARDINLVATPEIIGDDVFYLCQRENGARELRATSISRGVRELRVRVDASARLLGAAGDALYVGEEERPASWFATGPATGRLLRVALPAT